MHKDIERIVLTEEEIAAKVAEAAAWLDGRFANVTEAPLCVSVLKGSVFFFCDVLRKLKTPIEMDFMTVSSYGAGSQSSGMPKIVLDLAKSPAGKDVVLIEDIIDSGHTLLAMRDMFLSRGARSVTTLTLFDKPSRRQVNISADFSCFTVGNEFIVGYGLDYAQRYRNLPYVGVLRREIYEK